MSNITFLMGSFRDKNIHNQQVDRNSDRLSNLTINNDNGDINKQKNLKTWVRNFQVGIFWVGIFRGVIHNGGVWLVGIFRVVVFLIQNGSQNFTTAYCFKYFSFVFSLAGSLQNRLSPSSNKMVGSQDSRASF